MKDSEIETFIALAQYQNISTAAKCLFITQPALTRRLQSLETQLQCNLFTRNKGSKTIQLTPKGLAFLPLAKKWYTLQEEIKLLSDSKSFTHFTVTTMESISTCILPPVFKKFIDNSDGTILNNIIKHSKESYFCVENGLADLALIAECQFSKNINLVPLFKEQLFFITNIDSKYDDLVDPSTLLLRKCVKIQWNLESDMWFKYWFLDCRNVMANVEDMLVYEILLMERDAWTVAPSSVARYLVEKNKNLCIKELKEYPHPRTIYAISSSDNSKVLQYQLFLNLLKEEISRIPGITLL